MSNSALLNHEEIEQFAADMGDMAGEIFADLLDSLENDMDRSLSEMREALASNDSEKLRQAAHRLKGGSSNLGAASVASLCHELESAAGMGELTNMGPVIENLEVVCTDSMKALRAWSF